jgi:16S rRNA (guanine966-N2)-methyltransferase
VRVISGTFKGRRLVAPAGMAIRPTADRIKESLFNIMSGSIHDKRVLDLFAGTGALGIEALSRGAVFAVFVDRAKMALSTIRQNIQALGLDDRTRIIRWDILKGLNCLTSEQQAFDLVFMDPPYATGAVAPALTALISSNALAPGARIVIEHSAGESLVPAIDMLALVDQRRFGKTLVSFMDTVL